MEIPKFADLGHMNEFVKPVKLRAENDTDTNRIKRHITDFPGITVRDIVDDLDIPSQQVRNAIVRLNMNGFIRRCCPVEGEKRVRWEAGPDDNYENRIAEYGKPKQTTVSEWQPCKVTDPLIDLLFGRVK